MPRPVSSNPSDVARLPAAPGLTFESRDGGIIAACFYAMAGRCELLLESADPGIAAELGIAAAREAWRIEAKYSRFRTDSIVSLINRSRGRPVGVDAETAALLDYAAECYRLSKGRFDITSGVLRRCWCFDDSNRFPDAAAIAALVPLIGFDKLRWEAPFIAVPEGMEIDLGGIGKEYAVDRILEQVSARFDGAALMNIGGNLAARRAPRQGPWRVSVEPPEMGQSARQLEDFTQGGLAMSGNTRRYVLHDGVRYGHILDVRTGWPVEQAPRSVTVAASTCAEAGRLATFAMLAGPDAESFLASQAVAFWCFR